MFFIVKRKKNRLGLYDLRMLKLIKKLYQIPHQSLAGKRQQNFTKKTIFSLPCHSR
jgi:hypothetical protein